MSAYVTRGHVAAPESLRGTAAAAGVTSVRLTPDTPSTATSSPSLLTLVYNMADVAETVPTNDPQGAVMDDVEEEDSVRARLPRMVLPTIISQRYCRKFSL